MGSVPIVQEQSFIKEIPPAGKVFKTLLWADLTVQWRQRRALFMSLLLPVIFVISWKSLIPEIGGVGVLSICIAVGLPSTGLMGYSLSVARDREKGIFQRLRAAPIPTWTVMASRILVQLAIIFAITLVTCFFGYYIDGIKIGFLSLLLVLLAAVVGGLSFVALGQFVVAFIRSSEAVNSAVRLIYFPLAIVGALGEIGLFGAIVQKIVVWSPFGTTQTILAAALTPSTIGLHAVYSLLVTLGYGILFAGIGIRWFKWSIN